MNDMAEIFFKLAIVFFSIVIHEVAHGYMALAQGDRTALYAGRLTLNPIRHMDFFGMVVLPVVSLLAWGVPVGHAKPVPYNPYNLRNQRYGAALVAAAGPLSNIALAALFGLGIRALGAADAQLSLLSFTHILAFIVAINVWLAVINLVPIPPVDGSKVVFPFLPVSIRQRLVSWGHAARPWFSQYWFLLLIAIFFFGRQALFVIFSVVSPAANGLFQLFTGLPAGIF